MLNSCEGGHNMTELESVCQERVSFDLNYATAFSPHGHHSKRTHFTHISNDKKSQIHFFKRRLNARRN